MPEGPECERVRMSLDDKISGKTITGIEVRFDKIIKQQDVETFKSRALNSRISELNRRGKYLIAPVHHPDYEDELYLIVHLGMTGAWFNVNAESKIIPQYAKHAHLVLTLDDGSLLVYCDIRKFGGLRIFTCEEYTRMGPTKDMGPEWFWEDAEAEFIKRIKRKMFKKVKGELTYIPIKEAILDQSNLAGVGNIYASESLYEAKILPDTPVNCLDDTQLATIFRAARDIMNFSVSVGGSSISDYVDGEGKVGQMQNYLKVYGRSTCPCGNPIHTLEIAGRNSFYCPICQE